MSWSSSLWLNVLKYKNHDYLAEQDLKTKQERCVIKSPVRILSCLVYWLFSTWYHSLSPLSPGVGRQPVLLLSFLPGQFLEWLPSSQGKRAAFASLPLEHFPMLEMPDTSNKPMLFTAQQSFSLSWQVHLLWSRFGFVLSCFCLVLAHTGMLHTFSLPAWRRSSVLLQECLLSHEWGGAIAHCAAMPLPHSSQLLTDVCSQHRCES